MNNSQPPLTCSVFLDLRPGAGAWNMAVDEALLEAALAKGLCAVRVYRWAEPTISLGYFQGQQSAAATEETARSAAPTLFGLDPVLTGVPAVRRLSGGGALLHDRELTYSLVLPAEHPLARVPSDLYTLVHERIIALLAELGVQARLRGDTASTGSQPFFCFGRCDPRDIVIGRDKIVGSAQRRRHGAILQHGALLLERSNLAAEFAGLFDLAGAVMLVDDLAKRLAMALAAVIGAPEIRPVFDTELADRARELEPKYRIEFQTV